jgi:hypothetical protein
VDLSANEGFGPLLALTVLTRILYRLLEHGETYVRERLTAYEKKYQQRKLYSLQRAADGACPP